MAVAVDVQALADIGEVFGHLEALLLERVADVAGREHPEPLIVRPAKGELDVSDGGVVLWSEEMCLDQHRCPHTREGQSNTHTG